MAVLSEADRAEMTAQIMRTLSAELEALGLTKPQLRAAVDAADAWIDANASSYNTARPVAARNNLTPKQKARLLVFVIQQRFVRT